MKKYSLNLKKVFILLIISILLAMFAYYMLFIASDEEKHTMFIYALKYSTSSHQLLFGCVFTCGVFAFLIIIYMLELLIYKIKDILILEENGITYYAPEYKKVSIPKDKIQDIYIAQTGQMKIILKDYEIKRGFRARFWTKLKDMALGHNPRNIFRINLNFIKCDIKEIKEDLIQFNLEPDITEAKEEIKEILEQYNYSNVEELKNNEKALAECVLKLYNIEKFTQVEISAILKISTSKVSKIIRKELN